MEELHGHFKVTTARLKTLKSTDARIFTEKIGEETGTLSHSLARGLDFKIKTKKCFIIGLSPLNITTMIIVSRDTESTEDFSFVDKLKITTERLRAMDDEESQIFTERNILNVGAHAQGLATRCNKTITTKKCLVAIPNPPELLKAILVTVLTRNNGK